MRNSHDPPPPQPQKKKLWKQLFCTSIITILVQKSNSLSIQTFHKLTYWYLLVTLMLGRKTYSFQRRLKYLVSQLIGRSPSSRWVVSHVFQDRYSELRKLSNQQCLKHKDNVKFGKKYKFLMLGVNLLWTLVQFRGS